MAIHRRGADGLLTGLSTDTRPALGDDVDGTPVAIGERLYIEDGAYTLYMSQDAWRYMADAPSGETPGELVS